MKSTSLGLLPVWLLAEPIVCIATAVPFAALPNNEDGGSQIINDTLNNRTWPRGHAPELGLTDAPIDVLTAYAGCHIGGLSDAVSARISNSDGAAKPSRMRSS